jgi:glycosyltransferase involved in cell wall biosynthesis
MNDRSVEELQRRIDNLEAALRRERALLASVRQRHEHELAAARRQAAGKDTAGAKKRIARLERRLAQVHSSRTWKAGRMIWTAFHSPRLIAEWLRRRRDRNAVDETGSDMPRPAGPDEVAYTLVEDRVARLKYEDAVSRLVFSGTADRNIAIAVYTTNLDEGRGDIYTAVGLGRSLEAIGCEVVYLSRDRWYELPRQTDIYIALLESVDVTQLPADVTTVAWVRNETDSWIEQPSLSLFDLVLASSPRSLEILRTCYPGPTGLLRIGVDTDLFEPVGIFEDRCGVVSTVNSWGREREVNTRLRSRPIEFPLAIFGQQRGIAADLLPYCRGPVSYFALPSLYNEAGIVLDDFNHTTAAYGNVNSRVFEAAACGAVVMTNRSTGLDEAGLGDVAVFNSGSELHELVERHLGNSESLKAAEERASRVREQHSYAVRASELLALLDRLVETPATGGDELVVGHFPDYRDNPFAEMMWSALRQDGAVAVPLGDALDFRPLLRAADHRDMMFHLNWTAPILGASNDLATVSRRHRHFLEGLDELHDRGAALVWTVHNVLPHECADPLLEAQLRQEIADRVDVIHVMCEETAAACSGYYELPESKVRVLPHPSYIDVYPNLIDRETARYELDLKNADFVYLHLGKIRPYKCIDRLLDAFDRLSRVDRSVRLLLVGKPGRFEQRDEIVRRARANPNVIASFTPILNEDVQLYMNAADVVVLPYRNALNSGALQLAYSFAKPVVAAAVGCIASQVDATTGITFNWDGDDQALASAMHAARDLGPEHGRAAYERAAANHYLGIGRAFRDMIDEALSG